MLLALEKDLFAPVENEYHRIDENELMVVVKEKSSELSDQIVLFNQTGGFLWKALCAGLNSKQALVEALLENYTVDQQIAEADVDSFIQDGLENKVINRIEKK